MTQLDNYLWIDDDDDVDNNYDDKDNSRWKTLGLCPEKYLHMIVATASKQTNGSFWKTFTNGNTNNGRNLTSANNEDQWAKQDSNLKT